MKRCFEVCEIMREFKLARRGGGAEEGADSSRAGKRRRSPIADCPKKRRSDFEEAVQEEVARRLDDLDVLPGAAVEDAVERSMQERLDDVQQRLERGLVRLERQMREQSEEHHTEVFLRAERHEHAMDCIMHQLQDALDREAAALRKADLAMAAARDAWCVRLTMASGSGRSSSSGSAPAGRVAYLT